MSAPVSDRGDFSNLAALRAAAAQHDPHAIAKTAQKFESLFAEQMVKSMRAASFGDAMFPGQSQLYRDLYDKEIARRLTEGKGLGLAPVIQRALGRSVGQTDFAADHSMALHTALANPHAPTRAVSAAERTLPLTPSTSSLPLHAARSGYSLAAYTRTLPVQARADTTIVTTLDGSDAFPSARAAQPLHHPVRNTLMDVSSTVRGLPTPHDASLRTPPQAAAGSAPNRSFSSASHDAFVAAVWPHAQRAAAVLGVSPRALVAQAALESGWGKHTGGNANLFGIKAGGRWQGATSEHATREFVDGAPRREVASFRSYASVGESFDDYARLLKSNPRYGAALAAGTDEVRFARALQSAGYATDPDYSAKVVAIANGPMLGDALQKIPGVPLLASR